VIVSHGPIAATGSGLRNVGRSGHGRGSIGRSGCCSASGTRGGHQTRYNQRPPRRWPGVHRSIADFGGRLRRERSQATRRGGILPASSDTEIRTGKARRFQFFGKRTHGQLAPQKLAFAPRRSSSRPAFVRKRASRTAAHIIRFQEPSKRPATRIEGWTRTHKP